MINVNRKWLFILFFLSSLLMHIKSNAQQVDGIPEYLNIDESKFQKLNLRNEGEESILIGRTFLDAKTFSKGPTSGQFIGEGPINSQNMPFLNQQPVQGFSSVYNNGDGTYFAMSDNGFGSIENSADYNLRVYKIGARFKSWKYGRGDVKVLDYIELKDPDKHIPFAIVNEFSPERILTGADFDIESFQIVSDGTYWFGDEFGPFLIHTDNTGLILEAPIALPDFKLPGKEIRSPQNPLNEEGSAIRVMNAMRSHALSKKGITPVFSPWHVLLEDNNPNTFVGNRKNPVGGLAVFSSEIFNIKSMQKAGFNVVL